MMLNDYNTNKLPGEENYNYGYYNEGGNYEDVMTIKDWIFTLIILAIPLINLIMYFYWSFAPGVNLNKKNFTRATLILTAIGLLLGIVLMPFGYRFN